MSQDQTEVSEPPSASATGCAPGGGVPSRLLEEALATLPDLVRGVGARCGLSRADAEDLLSTARLRLLEAGGQALRDFRGACTLSTYLRVMLQRMVLDERTRRWGRWRPSAEARRQGPAAEELERLCHRDGLPFDAAYEILRARFPSAGRAELASLLARLPGRATRVFVGEEAAGELAAREPGPEAALLAAEGRRRLAHATRGLAALVVKLPPQDRLILRLRFEQGMRVADIAQLLRLPQRPLYRRIEGLLSRLREEMSRAGFDADQVRDALGSGERALVGPSIPEGHEHDDVD